MLPLSSIEMLELLRMRVSYRTSPPPPPQPLLPSIRILGNPIYEVRRLTRMRNPFFGLSVKLGKISKLKPGSMVRS